MLPRMLLHLNLDFHVIFHEYFIVYFHNYVNDLFLQHYDIDVYINIAVRARL